MDKSDCVGFIREMLAILKLEEIGIYGVQNQTFWVFFRNLFIRFSKIESNDRHQKVGESDCFGFTRETLIMSKLAKMGNLWAQNQHFLTQFVH